jgi:proteic killer suppression protein
MAGSPPDTWRKLAKTLGGSIVDACCATRYTDRVIKSFRHKGIRRFYNTGSKSRIQANHVGRLRLQLAALGTAHSIDDMDVPGYRLHPLKGKMKGRWSIWVSGNWRLTFEFVDGNAHVLDYEDYHK